MTTSRRIHATLLGHEFRFEAHPGLFSADRVDDGTRLLLEHLPVGLPRSLLDLGCGYGALGLPVAAAFPDARALLVDRDMLAVEYTARNAASHGLGNVEARGSLGYRDVGGELFDWVLCNVPARIGEAAIAYMLGGGAARLNAGGELRVVVIRDLGPVVERVAFQEGWKIAKAAEGARHLVYAMGPHAVRLEDHETLYRRDHVSFGPLVFERPHDINEDHGHQREGVPLVLECLPKSGDRALTWRAGYGPVPVALAKRGLRVVASDRDLLALAYVQRNAKAQGLAVEAAPMPFFTPPEAVPLVVGELYANVGAEGLALELEMSQRALAKGGQALWLGLSKVLKELKPALDRLKAVQLASRGAYAVVRVPSARR